MAAELGYEIDTRELLELIADEPDVVGEAIGSVAAIAAHELTLELLGQALDKLRGQWPAWQLGDGLKHLADVLVRLDETHATISEGINDSRAEFRTSMRHLVGTPTQP
ncbi:hypothetical protein OG792_00790 [Micromonospora sp. NBC_01699]|uniref:hypothetical protein n=1 Tax=Micromonospora sp. NBC_01699 TaxID=2975984 RepID=UPI002E2C07AC|nr:hypothetical protein [Micromonospora sp. NBC_01699]